MLGAATLKNQELEIPHLATTRLELQPLSRSHSFGMYELWSAPEVCEYSGSAVDFGDNPIELPVRIPTDSDRILDFFMQHQRQGSAFRWAMVMKQDSTFVGAIGFNSLGSCSEIAYHLCPTSWGKGIMFEACCAAILWVASSRGSTSVEAFVEPQNAASIKLLRRLEFTPTGESRDGANRYLFGTGDD